jgi:colanic acid/amylovoran biosynthesis glycosyltransferase
MKPKVIHFVETFLARSEIFIYNYISAHSQWQPVVLTKRRINDSEFPVNDVIEISSPITKRSPRWWKHTATETLTGRSPWHRTAEKSLRHVGPSLLHAHFGHVAYGLLPIKKRLNLPLVTSFYGYDMSVLPRQAKWRDRFSRLFAEGDLFLVEGPCMRQRLVELGAAPEKVAIQRIAINPDNYPSWKPSSQPTVLFVGRFTEKKGLLNALRAFDSVRKRRPELTLRVIGDGEEREAAQILIREKGMNGDVVFLGMRSHSDVIQELAAAHVLIHPSMTATNGDTEGGAPTVLLEAQAIGVPIVSTLHADIPNVARSPRGIFLSPERDVISLANYLESALQLREGTDATYVREFHNVAREILLLEAKYQDCLTQSAMMGL